MARREEREGGRHGEEGEEGERGRGGSEMLVITMLYREFTVMLMNSTRRIHDGLKVSSQLPSRSDGVLLSLCEYNNNNSLSEVALL